MLLHPLHCASIQHNLQQTNVWVGDFGAVCLFLRVYVFLGGWRLCSFACCCVESGAVSERVQGCSKEEAAGRSTVPAAVSLC